MTTDYHAKYDAHLLTRRSASDCLEKLGASLLNATVDLNPHQIDAALSAFDSPLSRGAILADEAGLIVSQLWAERAHRILIIVPRCRSTRKTEKEKTMSTPAFDRITIDPGKMNGQPCIRGLRLTVRRVLEALGAYPSREELKADYPDLDDEDIRQALAYAGAMLADERVEVIIAS